VEAYKFFTPLFIAMCAVFHAPLATALFNLASLTVADLSSSHSQTSIAVYIFRLQIKSVLLSIKGGGVFIARSSSLS